MMRTLARRLSLGFLLAGCLLNGCASGRAWSQELPVSVAEAFKRAGIATEAVGIYVQEVGDAAPMLASNQRLAFNPASTMKLVTTDAALELLGPTFTWKTQAYADGRLRGDVLQGDLIIKGSGDPKLVIENFWLFLRQIRAKGIREINGNVLLDRSAFEESATDAATFDGDPLKTYNAGPDALLLNYKAFGFRFAADTARGTVNVMVDPPMAAYRVTAPALSNGSCDDWQQKLGATIYSDGARFGGAYSAACGEKTWNLHPYLMTQTQYFEAVFRQMWRDVGGVFKGEVKSGVLPPEATLVAQWESATLPEVIRDINKYSNNVMARQLLLTLAVELTTLPATTERGARVIKSWLANKGIDAPDLIIDNGSGLSRSERISAGTLGRLLVAAFNSPTMPEFMSSLPLAGVDGTMRKRLKNMDVAGKAHIKTGSLKEVRALAGYVLAASGKRYAIVCLINHANAGQAMDAQDLLLQWIYERG